MHTKQNKGFTLLEILLVIAAIGILAAIVLVAINPNRQIAQARNTVRQADINTIQKAVEQYLIEKGSYPSSITTTPGYICNTGTEQVNGSTNCSGRVDLRELVPTYIAGIPKDPQATGTSTGYNIVINPNNNKTAVSADLAESKLISLNPYIVTNGLVLNLDAGNPASYPGTGNIWFDLSGNNNNGTLVNGVGYNSDNGGSLVFDGVNDYVDLSSSTYNYTTQNSILVAFRPSNVFNTWGEVFQKGNRFDFRMRFSNNTGKFELFYQLSSGSVSFLTSEILSNNQWYIAQMTIDCSTNLVARFYLNGIKRSESLISPGLTLQNGTSELRLGNISQGGGNEVFNGRIGIVKMYDRFLNENEIQQNFNATRGRFGL
jgi:prepilin-type N-terminal cleavage/methylation domain-containing protein